MQHIRHIRHIGEVWNAPICWIRRICRILGYSKLHQYVEYLSYWSIGNIESFWIFGILAVFGKDDRTLIDLNIFVALQPEKLGTLWQYMIEWYPGGSSNQQSLVKLTSQPRYGEDSISLHIWTNSHSQTSDIVTSQHPLAIYARVLKGTRNVLHASVKVTVTVTKPDGTGNTINLKLKDDGSGGK